MKETRADLLRRLKETRAKDERLAQKVHQLAPAERARYEEQKWKQNTTLNPRKFKTRINNLVKRKQMHGSVYDEAWYKEVCTAANASERKTKQATKTTRKKEKEEEAAANAMRGGKP